MSRALAMSEAAGRPRHLRNPNAASVAERQRVVTEALPRADHEAARREITSWPGYAPTPIVSLEGTARAAGVTALLYKDEAHRFALGSFKALGGAYAVLRVLQDHLRARGIEATAADLIDGSHLGLVRDVTVACATDGNHGRSVAWGARMFGCACRIYIHAGVSKDREEAIAAYGATMVRTGGDYDQSVHQCAHEAAENGWVLTADTNAGGGSPDVPRMVTMGYTIMVDEMMDQLDRAPTHVFIPAGVGGLAAAIAGHWARRAGADAPRMVVVEPHAADCVYRSLATGAPTEVDGNVDSFMACLSAGEVSPVAWPILRACVDDVVTIPDEAAAETMRALAEGRHGDAPLVSGESGCAPVAALLALANEPELRAALGLDGRSRVVAIGSEGATAPEIYERTVGRSAEAVNAAREAA